jgi:hypothetical protein
MSANFIAAGSTGAGDAAAGVLGSVIAARRPLVPTGIANCSARTVRGEIPAGGNGATRMNLFSMNTRRAAAETSTARGTWSGGARGRPGGRIIRDRNAAIGIGCG